VGSIKQTAAVLVPLVALVPACGASSSTGTRTARATAQAAASTDPAAGRLGVAHASAGLAGAVAVAKHTYANEINGSRVHSDVRLVAGDQTLLNDLSRGDLAGAQAEAWSTMVNNRGQHITRISVVNGSHVLVNAVWNGNGSFVVAPLARPLYLNGRNLGTLLVSVQDVVGYVKLVHVFSGAQSVVRGSSGQLRTSLPAAARVTLPSSGQVTIAGRRYRVGSFHARGWGTEALTVWVLAFR
jgi:hypothetical protein